MTQPATGTTWPDAGFSDLDARNLVRGKLIQAAIRDARGAATDISPHNADGSVKWSPFAQDNTWRDDLFARRLVNGFWVTNTDANEGFHLIGAFKEGEGPSSNPSIKDDKFMIEQSNFPFDTDLVEEGEAFSFTGVETGKPVLRRLRNNLRLSDDSGNVLVEDPGYSDAGWSKPLDGENVERQVLLVREYRRGGLPIYQVEAFDLVKLSNMGKSKMGKKDSEAAEMTWEPLPSGFFMGMVDGTYRRILKHTFVGGSGWTAQGGTPIVSATPPVATPGTTGKASIALADPTGPGDPFTFSVLKAVSPYTAWTAAAPDGASYAATGVVVSASGTTTIKVTGVTAGATKFEVVVTGTNGASTTSVPSNAATIT